MKKTVAAPLSKRIGWSFRVLSAAILLAAPVARAESEPSADAVREAARKHVEASAGRLRLEDPTRGETIELTFDHVHEGVKATQGGRQVVCVDFRSADGKLYDVDFYVDRTDGAGDLVVEDAVVHEVDGKDVLSSERRDELQGKP